MDVTYLRNRVRDGEIAQAGGLAARLANKKTNRDYRVGEKVYVTDIDVNDDDIQLRLLSLDTDQISVRGTTEQTRYKAILQFDFPKDSLATFEFARIHAAINSILRMEGAASTEPRTIEVGQTTAQVEAAMGRPQSILRLGTRTIYVYGAIKVTFVDDRVTDIQ